MMLSKIVRLFFYWFYLLFSVRLPANFRPLGRVFRKIRAANLNLIVSNSGRNLNVEKGALFSPFISIGHNSMLGENCRVYGGVELGENVLMGPDVKIYTRNHVFTDRDVPINLQKETFNKVIVENDVWIGANSIILPGVTIRKGSIIGAGSIVTKSTEEFSINCGNPAVIKGYR